MTQTSRIAVEDFGKQRFHELEYVSKIQRGGFLITFYLPRETAEVPPERTPKLGKKTNPRGSGRTRDAEAIIPPHPRRGTRGGAGVRFMLEQDSTQATVTTARVGRGAAFFRKGRKLPLHPSSVVWGGVAQMHPESGRTQAIYPHISREDGGGGGVLDIIHGRP